MQTSLHCTAGCSGLNSTSEQHAKKVVLSYFILSWSCVLNLKLILYIICTFQLPLFCWYDCSSWLWLNSASSMLSFILIFCSLYSSVINSEILGYGPWCWVELECVWAWFVNVKRVWERERERAKGLVCARLGVSTFSIPVTSHSEGEARAKGDGRVAWCTTTIKDRTRGTKGGIDYGDIVSTLWCATKRIIMMIFLSGKRNK